MDIEAWSDELELLDSDFDDYQEIDQLEPSDSFKIMEDFVYILDDSNKLKSSLIEALNKRKPFKEFKFVIDNSGKYRQMWFDFKNQELQKWVQNKLKK